MQRGVYFDGWYPRQHNYHPSLPARRLRMIDDLADMRATTLVWSALGGGSIALPYLEDEAYGEIPPRFRMYGFVNDSEFIKACAAPGHRGLRDRLRMPGMGIPGRIRSRRPRSSPSMNCVGRAARLDRTARVYPEHRPERLETVRALFPDGLTNSLGEPVTDLWEECACRDLDGNPLHAHWVEAPDRDHQAYYMDRNNPVWREYLKASHPDPDRRGRGWYAAG